MLPAWLRRVGFLLVLGHHRIAAINVEVVEILSVDDQYGDGEFEGSSSYLVEAIYGGVDPIDNDCEGRQCFGMLTRDGSLELGSRYGCTQPAIEVDDDDYAQKMHMCGVEYAIAEWSLTPSTIASVKIAFAPDSVTKIAVTTTVSGDSTATTIEWEGAPGTTELQEIVGLEGIIGRSLTIEGVLGTGEYLGILEVEIYVTVAEVEASGVSASTRASISATATTDETAAMNTLDDDATDASSWTCSSGEICEITYDLQAVESLEQVRIAFSGSTDGTGELNILAAGESGVFSSVMTGLEAGGRPFASDGLQTFGGVRALARYVKLELVPVSGGTIVITEVELRVGEYPPIRPVAEKLWLKETGLLPQGGAMGSSRDPNYDRRSSAYGGCDSPGHLEGCDVFYIKDGDMSSDSRWSCGPVTSSNDDHNGCGIQFSLNIFRYVRQIKFAFHLGDEQHDELSIQAYTKDRQWATLVPSAITSGNTTDYQTFNVGVHTNIIRLVPKFQRVNQRINIKEMVILENRKKAFVEGTVPIIAFSGPRYDDDAVTPEATTRFKFDIPEVGDQARIDTPDAETTALRMRFPKDRKFVFDAEYSYDVDGVYTDFVERFTSAGGENVWETFTLLGIADDTIYIIAIEGPTFTNNPDYPALRVADFQLVGDLIKDPEMLQMVTTTMHNWKVIPDIIGDGASEQDEIMTAICETKGGTFDGTDCVGDLDDTPVHISLSTGDYFLDGPIFIKSGVTLTGGYTDDSPNYPKFQVYDGPNTASTTEDATIVIDGATNVEVNGIDLGFKDDPTGDIVPGTVGNVGLEVRNSQDIRVDEMVFSTSRSGGAIFTDSSNITSLYVLAFRMETGIFMELTRVDNFNMMGFPGMSGVRIDTCTNVLFEGFDGFEIPSASLNAPSGGDQTANVVITGDSSGITFKDTPIGPGTEPRILVESTEPIILDLITEYEDAVSGDCIIQVPEGTTEDVIVQLNAEQTLAKSGNCWVLV